jgi:hypothetical protein
VEEVTSWIDRQVEKAMETTRREVLEDHRGQTVDQQLQQLIDRAVEAVADLIQAEILVILDPRAEPLQELEVAAVVVDPRVQAAPQTVEGEVRMLVVTIIVNPHPRITVEIIGTGIKREIVSLTIKEMKRMTGSTKKSQEKALGVTTVEVLM